MSTFACPVVRIRDVQDHPNADRLNINFIGDFICISNKLEDGSARYAPGDRVVYFPEGAILPEALLRELGMWKETLDEETGLTTGKGILNGPNGDRIKAMRLRNVMSQGVIMPLERAVQYISDHGDASYFMMPKPIDDGDDLSGPMGVVKYEPPVPIHMAGQVCNIHGKTVGQDPENLKMHGDVFEEGEEVVTTEKLHGTNCQLGVIPGLGHEDLPEDWYCASKGLAAKGLVFKDNEENADNLYLKTVKRQDIANKIKARFVEELAMGISVYIMGEIVGPGVQKGYDYGFKVPTFVGFALAMRRPTGEVEWCPGRKIKSMMDEIGVPAANEFYRGPYRRTLMDEWRDGKTTYDGANHIREGIVIISADEKRTATGARKLLKHISDAYLAKTTGEEIN